MSAARLQPYHTSPPRAAPETDPGLAALRRHAEALYQAVNSPAIPFANNGSYCHDRAYAMAMQAERAGLEFELAYFLPASQDGMQVDGKVPWTSHVVLCTPEVEVAGQKRRLFIDPSLFEGGPVGLQQIQDRLKSPLEMETFRFGGFQPKQRPPHQRDDWEPYEYFGEGNRARHVQEKVKKNLRQAMRELQGRAPMPGDVLPAEPAKPSDGSLKITVPEAPPPVKSGGVIARLRQVAANFRPSPAGP